MTPKYHWLALLFILAPGLLYAQVVISGNIADSKGQAVSNATVTYRKLNTEIISGYALSDAKGQFSFRITLPDDSILINVKHLSFEEKIIPVKNEPQKLTIKLTTKIQTLPDIVVTSLPIYKRKDTVNYIVDAFASKNDRVIADIIKKLPGIEMDGDRILYHGKPIQKYFINGLDLLEGSYSLANNNLPVDAVQKVQVIENDQPIKILDSLIFSDKASLNVQLKKFTTTGTGKIGAGFSPFLRDVNLTPMTFNRNFQTINTLQSNNIGDDVSKQLDGLAIGNLFDYSDFADLGGHTRPVSFISIQEIASPGFNEKKWLDNSIHMLSSNFLQKLHGNLELKGNISYINDFRKKSGQSYTTLYTPGQKIDISETVNNNYNINDVRGSFIFLKNEKNIYFKNSLQLSKLWSNNNGFILKNDSKDISQRRGLENISLSNRFSAAAFWGKQLVNINSFIGYKQTPQSLSVSPGQFDAILNDSMPYRKLLQDVRFTYFNTDNYLGFVKGIKGFSIMPRFGISYQSQKMQSHIGITNSNNDEKILNDDFTNQLHFSSTIAYVDVTSQYRKGKARIDITTPFRLRNFLTKDGVKDIRSTLTRCTFEPRLLAMYRLNGYWEAVISSGYSNQYGSMNTLYNAYLLTSYRNLQKFNTLIPESNMWDNYLSLNYSNTLKSVFANLTYSNNLVRRNYLFRNNADESGFNTIEMATQNNALSAQSLSGNYSKYFGKIKTILKLNAKMGWSISDYLFNNSLEKMNTETYGGSIEVNNTSLKHLGFQYTSNVLFSNSYLSGLPLDKIFMNTHVLTTSIYPADNHTLIVNTEYYLTNLKTQKDQLFIDISYRTTLPKKKVELELSCLNLLNNRIYIRLLNADFSIIRNYFQLRQRQFLATVKFRF